MFLRHLSLVNYKNFDSKALDFDPVINCLVGDNGVGKTNVLDAVYHLCFGKSYFNPVSTQNIKHGTDFFVVEGEFEKHNRTEKILCSFKKGTKKVIKRNGKPYEKFSEHIGFLPLVIISPSDRDLILEGSETRRKFMDGVISQSDKVYLQNLIKYNKVVSQRNSLLKYFAANRTFDRDTLSIYNEQMNTLGTAIHQKRVEFIDSFLPIFKEQYQNISEKDEQIDLSYESQLSDDTLLNLLEKNIEKDRALQYTSVGVHKDDLSFTIAGHPIKKFGSQGQQKSFLIALKLAQFHFIKQLADTTPILLLDDIFDKLDENRVSHIVGLVKDDNFGQIFISDTHADRTEEIVKNIHQSYKIFNL
ncbi:DNA replication/repair protein RecF [Flagellimonas halotolerans]|uniref:DNA replication and repair protein RecF n=1 Tax=Flagellimonas halotolerans TaxID=3112164 RepID=A0ABU6IQL4_9FLAO|nr:MULTISPECIES: DNA replication/repair protein RecF [unclassified Allomuricauda]MEC3965543.1 DNA replication/repair protein RecF [Muricauda sp. SYSU M86414]MEC4265409.1 DNA replication/repair protein RecF [Muricauda sp. SYSU M84420]